MSTTHTDYPNLLGGLTEKQFLDEYWQTKPLLVRQAMPDIKPIFTPEELAGVCCESEISSRIVIEHGKTPWEAKYPPFKDQDFLDLPDTHWTLLVNDLETLFPELMGIMHPFNFIPDWRVDDLMVSYAPEGGSVGPHTDEYDVFLIQLQGKRRWQLDMNADPENTFPDLELSILKTFNADHDWVLEPGDMLYLPPNIAHFGTAIGDCMTYSIGFRSPTRRDLLGSWLEKIAEKPELKRRYHDARRKAQQAHGKITDKEIVALKTFIQETLIFDDTTFRIWLGETLTESKHDLATSNTNKDFDPDITYSRTPEHKFAWMLKNKQITCFISGESTDWPVETQPLIEYLCENISYQAQDLKALCISEKNLKLIKHFIHSGAIYES